MFHRQMRLIVCSSTYVIYVMESYRQSLVFCLVLLLDLNIWLLRFMMTRVIKKNKKERRWSRHFMIWISICMMHCIIWYFTHIIFFKSYTYWTVLILIGINIHPTVTSILVFVVLQKWQPTCCVLKTVFVFTRRRCLVMSLLTRAGK